MTNACAKKRSFIAECPNCKNLITLRSGNKREILFYDWNWPRRWEQMARRMCWHWGIFPAIKESCPGHSVFLSQNGGMETVNRKPRHQLHVPEVPRTCPKQPEWQVLSIYRCPVRKSVTALCRMQLMNCQVRHMPTPTSSLPPFLPSSLPPSLSQYLSNVACRNWRHGLWWNGKHLSCSICHSIDADRQARRPTGNEDWERLSA